MSDVALLRLLVARLLAEFPAMIAMARNDGASGAAGFGLAAWRDELAAGSTAAFAGGRLETALAALLGGVGAAVFDAAPPETSAH